MSGIVMPVSAIFVATTENDKTYDNLDYWRLFTYDNFPHSGRGNIEDGTLGFAGECRVQEMKSEVTGPQ